MPIPVPPHPGEAPSVDASADRWSRYLKLLELHQAAVIANQRSEDEAKCAAAGEAQAAATKALAAAQEAYAAAFAQNFNAKPTREELAWEFYKAMPQVTGLTDLGAVRLAISAADAFIREFPTPGPRPL